MKLLNKHVDEKLVVEDYAFDDSEVILRVIKSVSNPEGFKLLGYKDQFITFKALEAFMVNYADTMVNTIVMPTMTESTGAKPIVIKERNHFIEAGCLSMGKDRFLSLVNEYKLNFENE